jgi:4-amino-4-deoxy-L-arabinose transferase-like glycosyltransferase
VPGEGHQPPLAYALAAPALLWLPRAERDFDLPANWRFVWAGGAEANAVAHGSREHWPWRGAVLAWHLARLVNVAVGAATVVLTFLAARRLGGAAATVAAAAVALNPQFLFTSGLLTNDALLVALCAATLCLLTGGRATAGRAAALGVLAGLALLTKSSAVVLLPLGLGWCVAAELQLARTERTIGRAAARAALLCGAAALVAGWWYVRNWQLYGDPLGLAIFQAEFTTQAFDPLRPAAWAGALATLGGSFWARFGWMNVRPPAWVTWVYAAATALGLAGALVDALRRWRAGRAAELAWAWPLAAMPLLALAWVVSFALTAGLVAWQGRLAFPALPAVAVLIGWGLAGLAGPTARGRAVLLVLAAAGAGLAAWMPLGVIRPAYPFETLPAAQAVQRLGTPVYARFAARSDERGAELRGVRVAGEARPGATVDVTLMWHALGRQNRGWWVFVHLVDADENILAEDNRQPRDDRFPMPMWVAGDWVEDPHPLTLPADIRPGTYRLRVGLWYPNTGRRAGRFSAGTKLLGDYLDVGELTVRP